MDEARPDEARRSSVILTLEPRGGSGVTFALDILQAVLNGDASTERTSSISDLPSELVDALMWSLPAADLGSAARCCQ